MSDERDRLRRKLAQEFAPIVADLMAKVDKASRHMTLDALQCQRASEIYLDQAVNFLLGPGQQQRMNDVQLAQAHQRASKDDELESIERRARADVKKYGIGRTH